MGDVIRLQPPMTKGQDEGRAYAERRAALLTYANQAGVSRKGLLRTAVQLLADEIGMAEATAFMGALNYELRQGLPRTPPGGAA